MPMTSRVSSARSWPTLVPAFFMIEVAALGPWLDLDSAIMRKAVSWNALASISWPIDARAQIASAMRPFSSTPT